MRPDADRRRFCVGLGGLLLAGCAGGPQTRTPLTAEEQARLLSGLDRFTLSGRTSVDAAGERNIVSTTWRQRGDEAEIRISGAIGMGSLTLTRKPGLLHLRSSRGEVLEDEAALSALERQLGFVPPLEALRYWVLALPAPDEAAASHRQDDDGRLVELDQAGWKIVYDRWMRVNSRRGALQLPQRLTARRDDLQLRLVVDRWKLD